MSWHETQARHLLCPFSFFLLTFSLLFSSSFLPPFLFFPLSNQRTFVSFLCLEPRLVNRPIGTTVLILLLLSFIHSFFSLCLSSKKETNGTKGWMEEKQTERDRRKERLVYGLRTSSLFSFSSSLQEGQETCGKSTQGEWVSERERREKEKEEAEEMTSRLSRFSALCLWPVFSSGAEREKVWKSEEKKYQKRCCGGLWTRSERFESKK